MERTWFLCAIALLQCGLAPADGECIVIDLEDGPEAARYRVEKAASAPEGGWGTDAKTRKLVLRRVPGEKPFYLGVFEVTQRQYELVTGANPSAWRGPTNPVECVSFNAIRGGGAEPGKDTFFGVLRRKTGLRLDLPTDAEWEYACRAGGKGDWGLGAAGEMELSQLGRHSENVDDGRGEGRRHVAVGLYAPNAWGLYDMHGNVFEWCLDLYDDFVPAVQRRKGEGRRVLRGGSWYSGPSGCRASSRHCAKPDTADVFYGFRLKCPAKEGE